MFRNIISYIIPAGGSFTFRENPFSCKSSTAHQFIISISQTVHLSIGNLVPRNTAICWEVALKLIWPTREHFDEVRFWKEQNERKVDNSCSIPRTQLHVSECHSVVNQNFFCFLGPNQCKKYNDPRLFLHPLLLLRLYLQNRKGISCYTFDDWWTTHFLLFSNWETRAASLKNRGPQHQIQIHPEFIILRARLCSSSLPQ